MLLRELLNGQSIIQCWGGLDVALSSLVDDSRKVMEGSVYVAVSGTHQDGHAYIDAALASGAVVIVAEKNAPAYWDATEKTWVKVSSTSDILPRLASTWYHCPAMDMKLVGITGTNGKTTTAYIVHSLFKQVWHRAGLIGTVVFDNGCESFPATHTTPGTLELNALLAQMARNDCRGVAMEVSSHALTQNRVDGIPFDVALFTNLSQDHLDYHKTMEAYYAAKKSFFERLVEMGDSKFCGKKPIAVINVDDAAGQRLATEFEGKVKMLTYGLSNKGDVRAIPRILSSLGTQFELQYKNKSYLVKTPLVGKFNLYNALGALTAALAVGVPTREAVKAMSELPQVPGRLELLRSKNNIQGFVDYAHTPDALENVCKVLKGLTSGRLIVVFGCGGDRDTTKRPLMGEAVARYADMVLVTSDNPRSEDPEKIIEQIIPGLREGTYRVAVDRKEAIRVAVELAVPGDVVLVAGKGHEDYQELATGKVPFNDKLALRMSLENWGNY